MVLKFVNTEPMGRMIEWIDCGSRPDGTKRSHCCAGKKRMFVHSRIFSDRYLGTELGIAAEIKWSLDLRADNFGARKDPYQWVRVRYLTGGILEKIDVDGIEFHAPLPLKRPRAKCSHKANES